MISEISEISAQRERDFALHSTQAKLIIQGFFCRWAYLIMNLCKRGRLICWILRYCNAAAPSCVLWKHGCTHFPGFILRNIPNKLGFWNDVSKNIQIYRSILVLIIFMLAKVGVLYVGIWKSTYRNISYIFAFFFIYKQLVNQRQSKKISLSNSFKFFFLFSKEYCRRFFFLSFFTGCENSHYRG